MLGGGCALNSSYNGTVIERTEFDQLHVPCSPGDDGCALGAALLSYQNENPRVGLDGDFGSPYLGSTMSQSSVDRLAGLARVPGLRRFPGTIHREAARRLAAGKILGWVQGRSEFGPRALGNRSILADPRLPNMKESINSRVKFREEFRPFAPAILDEYGDEYFEDYQVSRYMERTLRFRDSVKGRVPAVVHVDGTGRLQTVKKQWNTRFHALLTAFFELSGVPVLLNTSFNVMGRPIVHSVEDILGAFYSTGLDAVVIEDYLIEK